MKHFILLIVFLSLSFFCFSQNDPVYESIENDYFKVDVKSNGLLFNNDGKSAFEYPLDEETTLMNFAGIWLGAYTEDKSLKLDGHFMHEEDLSDFQNYAGNWNKIWKVSKAEIVKHKEDFEDDGIIQNKQTSIYAWPGRASTSSLAYNVFEMPNEFLADFFDQNGDGIYEPDKGDYPSIGNNSISLEHPNEMLWFKYKSINLDMEIHCTIYTLDEFDFVDMSKSIFVQKTFKYNGFESLFPFYFGSINDFAIGCEDDYFGTYYDRSTIFSYNADNDDTCNSINAYGENPPALALSFLRGPLIPLLSDYSIPPLGVAPDTLAEAKLNAVIPSDLNGIGQPEIPKSFYDLLMGTSLVGTTLNQGQVFFDGNPSIDKNTELAKNNDPGHRQVLASFCPLRMNPGSVNRLVWVYTVYDDPGNTNLENVENLFRTVPQYVAENEACFLPTSTERPNEITTVLFPNPAKAKIFIKAESNIESIEIVDIEGRSHYKALIDSKNIEVNVLDFTNGIYIIKLRSENGIAIKKFLKVN